MKFIIDAQLPYQLALLLTQNGIDAIHTDNLPTKERTTDNEIREISLNEKRIVITKDIDFLDSFYIKGVPSKLLLITTGNIKNKQLLQLFKKNLSQIIELFHTYNFIELNNSEIIGHE